jgi:hypothetical protein
MQTFDQHLLQHLHAGRVTMEAAMRVATSPHDFKLMVAAAGKKPGDDGPEAEVRSNGNGAAPAPTTPLAPSAPPAPVSAEPVGPPPSSAPEPAFETSTPPAPPSYETQPPPSPSAPPPGVTY